MKPTTIEFSFDDAKLDAINIFLKDKNATLSEELDRFMDALYPPLSSFQSELRQR